MYLSKLELIGFKSFAQKVNLTFDSGITAIVGPNGCGKTNIVDAIRWVLGEQRSSALRSDKMEDVIFNGTRYRKPLSMAEVSLTIENTRGILPTEYSEVTITRRVYRSGESEYLFNGTPCRLKDIVDLFMDTGMGADAYSVIELKMVETILSDKAEERRRLFEEAAGVTKYKHRRKTAYRKLESVQQDLVRVNDIVREVQKTVSTLERQARKAEQYNEISQRLRALEIELLEREYAATDARLRLLDEKLQTAIRSQHQIDEMLSKEEGRLDELRSELKAMEESLASIRSALDSTNEKIHGLQQQILVENERRRSLEKNINRYERESQTLEERRAKLEDALALLRQRAASAKDRLQGLESEYNEKKSELSIIENDWSEKKSSVKSLNDHFVRTVEGLTAKKLQAEQLHRRIENARGRIERIREENSHYEAEIEKTAAELVTLGTLHREARRTFAEVQMKYYEKEKRKEELQREVEGLRNREFDLRATHQRLSARLEFLKSLVETHEDLSEATKYLVSNGESRTFVQTTVGEAVHTEAEYRTAVESALGEAVNYIVVNDLEEAYHGVELLKRSHKGKATFICLNRIPEIDEDRFQISSAGAIGWAIDLVEFNPKYQSLFRFLLDRTLVVSDVQIARALVSNGSNLKCVTLDGEIVTSTGVMKGGSRVHDNGHSIGKRQQIDELEVEVMKLSEELASLQRLLGEKSAQLTLLSSESHSDDVKQLEHEVARVEMRMAQIEFEKKRTTDVLERNRAELDKVESEIVAHQSSLESMLHETERLVQLRVELEEKLRHASQELEECEARKETQAQVVNECWSRLVKIREDEREIARELQYTEAAIREASEAIQRRRLDIEASREELKRLATEVAEKEALLEGAQLELQDLRRQCSFVEAEYAAKREQLQTVEASIRNERKLHDDSLGATHELEIKISECRIKLENMRQRAAEEFDHVLFLKSYAEKEEFSFEKAQEEIQQLKNRIRNIGPVNFAALEEYKSEKQRLDFLTTQRNDLLEAEKTLLKTIEEINTTAQRKFLDTFEKIRQNFKTTFNNLFDEGDECDLRLEEGVDPLEARIEIIAKPRGKRPQSIDLLSAGEKTLTAIALLFAIYLVKPSPFCILDEVDAPLDDSNIDRYTRILNKFSSDTQFIVVTHNKRTMEAANALYGVTMEEDGVSKLVSVRLTKDNVTQN